MKSYSLILLPILLLLAIAYALVPVKYLPPWTDIIVESYLGVFLIWQWKKNKNNIPNKNEKNLLGIIVPAIFLLSAIFTLISEYILKDISRPLWFNILVSLSLIYVLFHWKTFLGKSQTLYDACLLDDEARVKTLISSGKCDVNSQDERGNTALMGATVSGNKTLVSYLLQKGAQTNQLNNDGRSALHEAITFEQPDLLKLLLRHGGNANMVDEDTISLLQDACMDDNVTASEILLSYGADINYQDSDGWTALMFAVEMENIKTIRFLIQHGANISIKNNEGESARELAEKAEDQEIADLFKQDTSYQRKI